MKLTPGTSLHSEGECRDVHTVEAGPGPGQAHPGAEAVHHNSIQVVNSELGIDIIYYLY